MRNRMGSFKRKFVVASASALALGLAGLGTLPIYNNGVNVVQALEGYAKAAFSNKEEVESNVLIQQAKAEAQSKVSASWQVRTVEEVKTEIERQKAAGYPAYVIQWGDTLGVIATATNQSVADLAAVNQLTDVDRILTGDVLTGVLDKATIAEAKNIEAQRGGASTEPNQATQVTRTQEKDNVPSDKLVGSMKPAEESKQSDPVKPAEESKASDPVKPAEESKPSDSVKPAEGSKPSNPVKPAEESKPSDSVKPAEESKPSDSVKPAEESKPSDPVKPAEESKASDPVKPAEESKPSDPVKPAEESKASDPVKPAEESKPSDSVKPAEESKPSDSVKPAEESKPSDSVKPAEESKPSDSVKPAEESKASDPVKPAEESKPSDPVKPAEESKASDPVKPAEESKPSDPVKPAEESKPEETQPTPSESSSSEESKPAEPNPSEEPTTPEKPVEEFKAMPWKFTGKVDKDGIGEFEDPREFATEDEAVAYGYSMMPATGERTREEASASLQRATGGAQFKEGTTSSGFESTQGMDNPNWTVFHKIEMSKYLNK